jgi:TetR/AcrR family tetracycline transcriptional repressor
MPLSRSDVIEGALHLLDEEGIDALTMRRLADSLGVKAGAIYWHFADKQDLIDALGDTLMSGLLEPEPTGTWDQQLAELTRRAVKSLNRYRDGARLATMGLKPGPNGLALSEAMLRIVRDAGFDQKATLWATSVVGYYLLGYVTDVQATAAARARGLDAIVRGLGKKLDPKQHPQLLELTRGDGLEKLMSGREFEARFEFGLQVILNGLKQLRPARAPRRRRARPRRRSR